jgi:predicted anti-sigma-YlaC factor YlaD
MDLAGTECARARESVSADLDCELKEFDFRRLQAHLRVCADCSAWAEDVKATTLRLREAPFEVPAAAAFALPRRGRTWRVGAALAVAPAAALVASVVVSLGGAEHGRPATSTPLGPTDSQLVRNGTQADMYGLPVQHRVFQPV